MKKNKCPEQKQGLPEWMATYGDMVTLLMCFFVLLFAFSNIDAQKFTAVMQSFQGSAGVLSGGKSLSEAPFVFDAMPENLSPNSQDQKEMIEDLKEKIEEFAKKNDITKSVDVVAEERGLLIRLKDNILFGSGSAIIKKESEGMMNDLLKLLYSEEFKALSVVVEGHTDNIPSQTFRYPTNWELSTARATNVIRFFIEEGQASPIRFSAAGYGEYHPIASNDSEEGRAQNRRVDILLLIDQNIEENQKDNG